MAVDEREMPRVERPPTILEARPLQFLKETLDHVRRSYVKIGTRDEHLDGVAGDELDEDARRARCGRRRTLRRRGGGGHGYAGRPWWRGRTAADNGAAAPPRAASLGVLLFFLGPFFQLFFTLASRRSSGRGGLRAAGYSSPAARQYVR